MVNLLSFLFASGVGFGLACWILGTVLDKSNNIGDSHGSKLDYKAYVHFTASKDRLSKTDRDSFCRLYARPLEATAGPRGTERVRRLSEEELEDYKEASTRPVAERGVEGDVTNDGFFDNEDEFQRWRWENDQASGDVKSAFKPLDPQK